MFNHLGRGCSQELSPPGNAACWGAQHELDRRSSQPRKHRTGRLGISFQIHGEMASDEGDTYKAKGSGAGTPTVGEAQLGVTTC